MTLIIINKMSKVTTFIILCPLIDLKLVISFVHIETTHTLITNKRKAQKMLVEKRMDEEFGLG